VGCIQEKHGAVYELIRISGAELGAVTAKFVGP
jgi:hypothetical protein